MASFFLTKPGIPPAEVLYFGKVWTKQSVLAIATHHSFTL